MEYAARKTQYKDYSTIVKDILGYKTGIFLDIVIIIDIFVVITAYLVVIYSLIGRVIYDFNIIKGNMIILKFLKRKFGIKIFINFLLCLVYVLLF